MRNTTTNVNGGAGIQVGQPGSQSRHQSGSPPSLRVNPGPTRQSTRQPVHLHFCRSGITNFYPNNVRLQFTSHADNVAYFFYRVPTGLATNVAHVDNFDADFYIDQLPCGQLSCPPRATRWSTRVLRLLPALMFPRRRNPWDSALRSDYEETYRYAFRVGQSGNIFGTNFGNSTFVTPPGTAYNCLGVGAYAHLQSL